MPFVLFLLGVGALFVVFASSPNSIPNGTIVNAPMGFVILYSDSGTVQIPNGTRVRVGRLIPGQPSLPPTSFYEITYNNVTGTVLSEYVRLDP